MENFDFNLILGGGVALISVLIIVLRFVAPLTKSDVDDKILETLEDIDEKIVDAKGKE